MESSAPKRRRTSPRPAGQLPAPVGPESTTPKGSPPKPAEGAKRPSYASPTRASLHRHNPDILERRAVSPKRKRSEPGEDATTPKKKKPVQEEEDNDATPRATLRVSRPSSADSLNVSQALAAHLATQPPTYGSYGAEAGPSNSQRGFYNEANRENAASVPFAGLRSPARRAGSVPNPMLRTARPLPQTLGDDDEDLFNPFARRGLTRSPGPHAPEPELPPTPEHPDPVVSTPPSGIHNTPSKRPKRSKELAERLKSSSPLKQPAMRPSKSQLSNMSQPSQAASSSSSAPRAMTTAEMRGLPPSNDPDAQKKLLRDWLRNQVQDLERDLGVAASENERIQKVTPFQPAVAPPPNKDEITTVLRRFALTMKERRQYDPKNKSRTESPAWVAAALDPIAFLPFCKPSAQLAEGASFEVLSNRSNSTLETVPEEEPLPNPVSHHPVAMTSEEALPYLQIFTPLQFDTLHFPHPRRSPSEPLIMRHSIFVTTDRALYGLFRARIEADINAKTLAVISIKVDRLDPAAVSELMPFINSISSTEGPRESALTNNVSILGWAMSQWMLIALRRARFWKILDSELSCHNKPGLIRMVRSMRAGKRKRNGGKEPSFRRRRDQRDDDEETDSDDDSEPMESPSDMLGGFRAGDLMAYMGMTGMDYYIPVLSGAAIDTNEGSSSSSWRSKGKAKRVSTGTSTQEDGLDIPSLHDGGQNSRSCLQVRWRIEFDSTGHARSNISLAAGVPGKWIKHDSRGRLVGLSKLFDDLLQQGEDPLDAVRTVVCLLTGDPGPEPETASAAVEKVT